MGERRRPRSASMRGRGRSGDRAGRDRRGRGRGYSAELRSRERRAREKIKQLEARLREHNKAHRAAQRPGPQEQEEGWQVSGGGKAGRRARRRAAARERQGNTAPAGQPRKAREPGTDDLRFPEWMCLMCQEFQWATRLECRFCRAPRQLLPADAGVRAGEAGCPPERAAAAGTAAAAATDAPRAEARQPAAASATAPNVRAAPAGAPGGSAQGAPGAAAAAAADPAAVRDASAAVRAEEQRKLARLDAAILALGEGEETALASLREARQRCAERVAGSQPLGRRLAAARRAHDQAAATLKAAEKAAADAAETASRALEAEHAAAEAVARLEREVGHQRGRVDPAAGPHEVPGEVAEFVSTVDAWLQAAGVRPPPEVAAAAEALRARMPAPATPTDLCATMSDAASEAGAGEARGEDGVPASESSAPSRAASVEGRGRHRTPPPTQRPARPSSAQSR